MGVKAALNAPYSFYNVLSDLGDKADREGARTSASLILTNQ